MLASADPPIHLRQRRLLQNLFSPRYTRSFDGFVRAVLDLRESIGVPHTLVGLKV